MWFVTMPLLLLSLLMQLVSSFAFISTTYLGLCEILIYIAALINTICEILRFSVWHRREKKALESGIKPKPQNRLFQWLSGHFALIIILCMITAAAVFSFVSGQYLIGFATASIFVFLIIIFIGINIIQISRLKRTENVALIIALPILLSVIVSVSMFILVFQFFTLPQRENGILYSSKTFAAEITEYEYSPAGTMFVSDGITVTVFKSKYDFIVNGYILCETHILFSNNSNPADMPGWNADASYTISSNGGTVLDFGNTVISFNSARELDETDIENILRLAGAKK